MKADRFTQFDGPLAAEFAAFAKLLKSTGSRYTSHLTTIRRFDWFLEDSYPDATTVTRDILRAWCASFSHLRPSSQARYRAATHQLCKFLRRRDPATATLDDIEPLRNSRLFQPHIFSVEEVLRLLEAARQLTPRPTEPLRPWSMELIITLLYTAGLRIGEVVRLRVRDYDPTTASLAILETKFAKSRLVPLSKSAQRVLDSYLNRRRSLGLSCAPDDALRCCPNTVHASSQPCVGTVQINLVRLMRRCGLKPLRGRHGPRIHDMRHTWACHRVLQWYREGKDVQALLPILATYMGHRGLESSQRYLSLTPAVLHEASARFEKCATWSPSPEVAE